MNSLAVRLSSINNGEQLKKSSEIRVSLLDLPSTQEFHKIDDRASDDEANAFLPKFKEEYLSANTVEQQLVAVKMVNIENCVTLVIKRIGPLKSIDLIFLL